MLCRLSFYKGGAMSNDDEKHRGDLTDYFAAEPEQRPHVGRSLAPGDVPIELTFEGHTVSFAVRDVVVLGRGNSTTTHDLDMSKAMFLGHESAVAGTISRRHCMIERRGPRLMVSDLGSRNGTFLNGTRLVVGQFRFLQNGDTLGLGGLVCTVRF